MARITRCHARDGGHPVTTALYVADDRANYFLSCLLDRPLSRTMTTRADMRTDLFDFPLPPERIALRPARPRDAARLLVVRPDGAFEDRVVHDLPDLLLPGDQLVLNDTRVIPASLHGRRIGRGPETRIEANLVKRLDGSRWLAFAKPGKRLNVGDVVR